MLQNINSYGLSHLCAFSILEPVPTESIRDSAFNYPFLDIYLKNEFFRTNFMDANTNADFMNEFYDADIEIYSRGNKYHKTSFNNLFEYQIFNEQSGYKD